MNRKRDLLEEKKPDSASTESRVKDVIRSLSTESRVKGVIRSLSTESRVKDVIRSLQEVEKALEKINGDMKESTSLYHEST